MSNKLEIFSSYATDVVIDDITSETRQQLGGPAKYIVDALDGKLPYIIHARDEIVVEIHKNATGETGLITTAPPPEVIKSQSDWVIVSTILDEWQLVDPLPRYLFVDIQGFVRVKNSGKKQRSLMIEKLAGKIYCVKGTRREISTLSKTARDSQRQSGLLIATDGYHGAEIWSCGKKHIVLPPKIVTDIPDTIGAGDTWFGCFVGQMFIGRTVSEAAKSASDRAAEFLERKKFSDQ